MNPSLIFSSSPRFLIGIFGTEKESFGRFGTRIAALIFLEQQYEEEDEGNKRTEAI